MKILTTFLNIFFPAANRETQYRLCVLWWDQKKYLCDLIWYKMLSKILYIKIVLTKKYIFR